MSTSDVPCFRPDPRSQFAHWGGISPSGMLGATIVHAAFLAVFAAYKPSPLVPGESIQPVQIITTTAQSKEKPVPRPKEESRPVKPRSEPKKTILSTPSATVSESAPSPVAPSPAPQPSEPRPQSSAPTNPAPSVIPARFDADYLHNPSPSYPALSRRLGEEGKVVLRVFVEADGRPSSIEVSTGSGFSRLDQAALSAVGRWKFVPAKRGAENIGAWVLVPILFNLRG